MNEFKCDQFILSLSILIILIIDNHLGHNEDHLAHYDITLANYDDHLGHYNAHLGHYDDHPAHYNFPLDHHDDHLDHVMPILVIIMIIPIILELVLTGCHWLSMS